MDSAYQENPVQLGLLDSWSGQQSVCNVSWTQLEQTRDFINAMEIQNFPQVPATYCLCEV